MDGVIGFPDELAQRYHREGYWTGQTLGELLRESATAQGRTTALIAGSRRISYVELDQMTDRLAVGLLDLGIVAGDRVVLHLPNVPEFLVTAFALFRLGAVPVFALPPHREAEIRHMVAVAEAVAYVIPGAHRGFDHQVLARAVQTEHPHLRHVLVTGNEVDDRFTGLDTLIDDGLDRDAARARVEAQAPDPSEVALFLLSGGTTGLPKLIPRTHDDYAYNVRASTELCRVTADDVYLVALPIAHNFPFGCFGAVGTLHAGGTVVLAADPSPVPALALVAAEGVTATALVPALAIRWMDALERGAAADVSSLRLLQVGGARLAPEAAGRVRPVLGATLQQVFGMAEGLLNYTRLDDPGEVLVDTQGRPLSPADEIRIVDEDDRPVVAGRPGRLETRGPYTLHGYYRAPDANAASFTTDGFYRTGDVVRLHPSGNLVVEGRVKDFINRGGEKISAEEVEDHLFAHPDVAAVAVVAMPDRELNERVCAYVVPHDARPVDLDQLRAHLRARGLATFKLPERLEVVDALPLTNVGKVAKRQLREDIAAKLDREAADPRP